MKAHFLRHMLPLVIGLAIGLLVASQVNAFLGITCLQKDLPTESRPIGPPVVGTPEPLMPVEAVILPASARQDDLYVRAAEALADALEERSGVRPRVLEAPAAAPPGPTIMVGTRSGLRYEGDLAIVTPDGFSLIAMASRNDGNGPPDAGGVPLLTGGP